MAFLLNPLSVAKAGVSLAKGAYNTYQNNRGAITDALRRGSSNSVVPSLMNAIPGGPLVSSTKNVIRGVFTQPSKTSSLAGTPVSTPEPQPTPQPAQPTQQATVRQAQPQTVAMNTPQQTAQPESSATRSLRAESDLVQSGRKREASALSDLYTGRAAAAETPRADVSMAGSPVRPTQATPMLTASKNPLIEQLRGTITSLSTPSAEEQALQDELTSLEESARLGVSGLEGQGRGIPLSLIRGEQTKLSEQANIKAQTLMERIAAKAAQRNAALQAAQNEYAASVQEQERQDEFARYNQQRQDQLTAPTQVGGSLLQYDPATGTYKTLYSAPQGPADQPATVQEYEYAKQNGYTGSFLDYQRETSNMSSVPGYQAPDIQKINGVDYQWDASTGNWERADVPGSEGAGLSDLGKQALSLVGELITDKGREGATGTLRLFGNVPGTPAYDYKAKLQRLQSLLSLDSIKYLKGTGAISDKESAILESASAALKPGMSEGAFLAELKRVQDDLKSAQSGDDIDQFLDSFSNDLSTSQNGSLGSLSERFESGGNPGAIGYDSTGGYSYGTYQLAHNNAQNFINQSEYAGDFSGIAFNSPQYRAKWQEIAKEDPQGFAAAQKDYIKRTHFDPQMKRIADAGIDVTRLNPVVLDAIWSTAVQHGPSTQIVVNALKNAGPNPADQIKAIYTTRWSGGQNFASSTSQVQSAVKNRLKSELKLALQRLNQSSSIA